LPTTATTTPSSCFTPSSSDSRSATVSATLLYLLEYRPSSWLSEKHLKLCKRRIQNSLSISGRLIRRWSRLFRLNHAEAGDRGRVQISLC
jgi:hypothetical protein